MSVLCIGKLDRVDKEGLVIKIGGYNQSKLERVRRWVKWTNKKWLTIISSNGEMSRQKC